MASPMKALDRANAARSAAAARMPAEAAAMMRAQRAAVIPWPAGGNNETALAPAAPSPFLPYVLTDVAIMATVAASVLAITLHGTAHLAASGGMLFLRAMLVFLLADSTRLYSPSSGDHRWRAVLQAELTGTLLILGLAFVLPVPFRFYLALGTVAAIETAALGAWRDGFRQRHARQIEKGIGVRHVLIVGSSSFAAHLRDTLETHVDCEYSVRAVIEEADLDTPEGFDHLRKQHLIDEVLVAGSVSRQTLLSLIARAGEHGLDLKIVPEFSAYVPSCAGVEYAGRWPMLRVCVSDSHRAALAAKRAFDVTFSALLLAATLPLWLAIAAAIKFTSPGPVFYKSERVGRKGRHFSFLKFRSMTVDADARKAALRAANERKGAFFKIENDPRITRVGRLLRRTSLDELPQLWNVLRGDMSLVGPRPHPVDDVERYSLDDYRRLHAPPGLTGLWQVTARCDPSFETNMRLDLAYIQQWSFWLDLKILLRTIPTVLRCTGR